MTTLLEATLVDDQLTLDYAPELLDYTSELFATMVDGLIVRHGVTALMDLRQQAVEEGHWTLRIGLCVDADNSHHLAFSDEANLNGRITLIEGQLGTLRTSPETPDVGE